MKNIKYIFLSISLFTLFSFNSEYIHVKKVNEVNQLNPFSGHWKLQDGNKLFIVRIWTDANGTMLGHYKKITVDASATVQTSLIYDSVKGEINWPYAISLGKYTGGNVTAGNVIDNTVLEPMRGFIDGNITLTLQSSCLGCPKQMHWKVVRKPGIRSANEPDYNIPTDIVLTKFDGLILEN